MKTFFIDDSVLQIFPEISVGVILCKNVNNHYHANEEEYLKMIRNAEKEAANYITMENFPENPVIKIWRTAFQKFKTKKGARCSIEALLKRIEKGNPVNNINPLVDIYNTASMKYAFPIGGEDWDKIQGDLRLTCADGNEHFVVLGSGETSPPYPEEIIYKDDGGAVCRCLNWRESERTMLTEETGTAFMCIESVDPERSEAFQETLIYLKQQIETKLGAECSMQVANKENPRLTL